MDAGVALFIFQHAPLEDAVETHATLNWTYTDLLRASCLRLLSTFSAREESSLVPSRRCCWSGLLDRPSRCISETRYRRADGRCWSVFKLQKGRHCQSEVRQLRASCCCFGLKFHMWTNMHSLIILKIFDMHIDRADIHEICLCKLICRAYVISRLWFICSETDLKFL